MVNVVIEHVEHVLLFITSEGLDQKLIVVREKEEGAALASSFTRFEDHVSVVVEAQALHHVLRLDPIQVHKLREFGLLIAVYCRSYLNLIICSLLLFEQTLILEVDHLSITLCGHVSIA
jgi:hypothetical protein